MAFLLVFLATSSIILIPGTQSHDLFLGYPDYTSRLIYSKVHQANPAIWVRSEDIVVNCSSNQIINAIKITDLREDKWGEAWVKSGGIGQKTVTIELDSPTIFRGYNFWVEVYAIETGYFMNNHGRK